MKGVEGVLRVMAGATARCMYCLDSHGTDVEHFWPKSPYPERMFVWPNLLLSCAECGRLKGDRFPLQDDRPLLIDPTADDPWQHLDFDPDTGNLTAKFVAATGSPSPKGVRTVEILRLDQREAMSRGYLRTFRRIAEAVLETSTRAVAAGALIDRVRQLDDHGLAEWCFGDRGRTVSPFRELHARDPAIWAECALAFLTK